MCGTVPLRQLNHCIKIQVISLNNIGDVTNFSSDQNTVTKMTPNKSKLLENEVRDEKLVEDVPLPYVSS